MNPDTGIHARFKLDYPGFSLDVDLALPGRGVTALFGHSGSGKTTLLRAIAGLERVPGGRLAVNGETWQDESAFRLTHRRPLGYVFQEAACSTASRTGCPAASASVSASRAHLP
jgi:molybdate transport system ATP-binding protein